MFPLSDGTVERKRATLAIAHRARPSGPVAQLAVGRVARLPDRFSGSERGPYDDHAPSAVSGVGQYHTYGTTER